MDRHLFQYIVNFMFIVAELHSMKEVNTADSSSQEGMCNFVLIKIYSHISKNKLKSVFFVVMFRN